MKHFTKVLSLLLAAGMLLNAASCSKKGESKSGRDPSGQTEDADQTDSSDADGKEGNDGDDDSEDAAPVKKTVEVRDVFNDTLKLIGYGDSYCRVPEIIISDTDTMGVNSNIYTQYKRTIDYYDSMGPEYKPDDWEYEQSNTPLALAYDYFIADDFVSVVCHWDAFTLPEGTGAYYETRRAYNVSVEDGHELSKQEMLTLLGMTEDEFNEAVKKYYEDHWREYMDAPEDEDVPDYVEELNQQNVSDETVC